MEIRNGIKRKRYGDHKVKNVAFLSKTRKMFHPSKDYIQPTQTISSLYIPYKETTRTPK